MNTRTDADPNDDPAESTERPAAADTQPDATAAEGRVAADTSSKAEAAGGPAAGDTPSEAEAVEGSTAADTQPDAEATEDDEEFAHLDSLSDGAGCAEIWEHLSETRGEE